MGHLRGNLAAAHAEVGPDDQRQLHHDPGMTTRSSAAVPIAMTP
jgi:hypothetical protein